MKLAVQLLRENFEYRIVLGSFVKSFVVIAGLPIDVGFLAELSS